MVIFFVWGVVASLNELLVPHLRVSFDLGRGEALFAQSVLVISFLLFAFPAAKLVDRIGYQRTIVFGLLLVGAGEFVGGLAATVSSRQLFFVSLGAIAAGMTSLSVSANLYVIVFGDPERAASRLCAAQGFSSFGIAIGPAIGAFIVMSAVPVSMTELHSMSPEALHYYRMAQAASVRLPYLLLGIMATVMAAAIGSWRLPDVFLVTDDDSVTTDRLWSHPDLIFSSVAMLACVGAAASIARMLNLPRSPVSTFTLSPSSLLEVSIVVGLFAGAVLLHKMKAELLLTVCACAAGLLLAGAMVNPVRVALWSMVAAGACTSVMFPVVFTLAVANLGKLKTTGAALMVMATAGAAVVPAIQEALGRDFGPQKALAVPVLCFAYLMVFALREARLGGTVRRNKEELVGINLWR